MFLWVAVSLLGAAACQDYSSETWGLLNGLGKSPLGMLQSDSMVQWHRLKKEGCCLPDEMEALNGIVIGTDNKGKTNIIEGHARLYRDSKLGRSFIDKHLTINGGHDIHVQEWLDDTKYIKYIVINTGSGPKCTKSKLERGPWSSKCIPAGTLEMGNLYYGNQYGANRVNATGYLFQDKKDKAYLSVTKTSRHNECIPLTEIVYGTYKRVPFLATLSFANIVPKITNKDVFRVPSICKRNDVQYRSAEHFLVGPAFFF